MNIYIRRLSMLGSLCGFALHAVQESSHQAERIFTTHDHIDDEQAFETRLAGGCIASTMNDLTHDQWSLEIRPTGGRNGLQVILHTRNIECSDECARRLAQASASVRRFACAYALTRAELHQEYQDALHQYKSTRDTLCNQCMFDCAVNRKPGCLITCYVLLWIASLYATCASIPAGVVALTMPFLLPFKECIKYQGSAKITYPCPDWETAFPISLVAAVAAGIALACSAICSGAAVGMRRTYGDTMQECYTPCCSAREWCKVTRPSRPEWRMVCKRAVERAQSGISLDDIRTYLTLVNTTPRMIEKKLKSIREI